VGFDYEAVCEAWKDRQWDEGEGGGLTGQTVSHVKGLGLGLGLGEGQRLGLGEGQWS